MKKVNYIKWNAGYKEFAPLKTTIKQLDLWNKTKFSKRKVLDETVLEEQARYAHDNNLIYLVTILENEMPINYIEISPILFSVSFFDKHLREYMTYQFYRQFNDYGRENYGDRLFLEKISIRDYMGEIDETKKLTEFIFKYDGTLKITEIDAKTRIQTDSEAKNKIDVSANWEARPAFGNYDAIIKIERGLNFDLG